MVEDITNKIFASKKNGNFIVLNKTNKKLYSNYLYEIQFINTQYRMLTTKDKILKGNLKDKYSKSIYEHGYIGNTTTKENNKTKKSYILFCNILKRCYHKEDLDYKNYGAIGVKVCDEWLCFETFEKDIKLLENYNDWLNCESGEYHLDKDILQENIPMNNKVYSKDTCKFVKNGENTSEVNKRRGKTTLNGKIIFEAIHVDGRKLVGCGIYKFAKEYGLDAPTISNCLNGNIKNYHKGWSFKKMN